MQDLFIVPFVPKPTLRHMPGASPKLLFMLCTPTNTRTYDHTCERRSPTPMPRPKVTSVAGPSSTPMQRLRLTSVRRSRHTPLNMDESETKTTTNQNKIASAFKDEYNEYVRFTSSKYSDEKQLMHSKCRKMNYDW